jgi:hypothetical protein
MRAQVTCAAVLATIGACDLIVSPESLTGGRPAAQAEAGTSDADAAQREAGAPDAGPPGLVAYWSFDEGAGAVAHDQSGLRNDAVLHAGASWGAGHAGSALLVDGDAGYAFVEENASLSLTAEATILAWINLDDVDYDQRFVEKVYAYGIKLNTRFPQLEGGGVAGYAAMGTPSPPGEWHHVAFTFARGEVHAYFDGHEAPLSSAYDAGDTFGTWDAGLVIGGASDFRALAKGRIDELRIYARALTAAEVADLAR